MTPSRITLTFMRAAARTRRGILVGSDGTATVADSAASALCSDRDPGPAITHEDEESENGDGQQNCSFSFAPLGSDGSIRAFCCKSDETQQPGGTR